MPAHPAVGGGDLVGAAGPGHITSGLAGLLAYAVGFAALALWGYRRDEGASYR